MMSISQANEKLARLQSRLANVKQEAKRAAKIGIASLVVVGGGGAGGVIDAKLGKFPSPAGGDIEASVAVGTALLLGAALGLVDDEGISDNVALFGAGMLAGHAREFGKALAA
jgi:hypothetical protein